MEQVADACFGIPTCKQRHRGRNHRAAEFLDNALSMPPDLKLGAVPSAEPKAVRVEVVISNDGRHSPAGTAHSSPMIITSFIIIIVQEGEAWQC